MASVTTTAGKCREAGRAPRPESMRRYERASVPPFYLDRTRHCADLDNPDLMAAERGPRLREAQKVCSGCPFRKQCGEWAIEHGQLFNVYGGIGPVERRREIVRRAAALAGAR